MSLFMMAVVSCSKEETPIEQQFGDNAKVTYTVNVPTAVQTKTAGDGNTVSTLYYEVFYGDNTSSKTHIDNTAPVVNGEATITLDLVKEQTYTILFWAQKDNGVYDATELTSVKVDYANVGGKLLANQESFDAFYAAETITIKSQEANNHEITLTRPFAQLNMGTKDKDAAAALGVEISTTKVKVSSLPTQFNVFDGKVSGEQNDVEFTLAQLPQEELKVDVNGDGTDESYYYLSLNYLLLSDATDKTLVDITATFDVANDAYEDITLKLSGVPVERNYRTNIVGNLLTSATNFSIVVDEKFAKPDHTRDVWNGSIKAVAEVDGVYTITEAAELAWVAQQVNSGANNFEGKTVKLINNIDLNGVLWTPIGNKSKTFKGAFIGELSSNNSSVAVKSTASDRSPVIYNLKVDNNSYSGLFGLVGASGATTSIKNIKIQNAEIKSHHYAGALAGQFYGSIENCHVANVKVVCTPELINETQYDNGDKAGALVGYYWAKSDSYTIKNCSAVNSQISAFRDLGGLVGCSNPLAYEGNSVDNIVLILDRDLEANHVSKNDDVNINSVVGRFNGTWTDAQKAAVANDAFADKVSMSNLVTPATIAEAVKKEGATVALASGVYPPLSDIADNVTIIGTELNTLQMKSGENFNGVIVRGSGKASVISGKNVTVKNIWFQNDYTEGTDDYKRTALTGTLDNTTFENCIFDAYQGVRWAYAKGTVSFKNCTFGHENSWRGVHFDSGSDNPKLVFEGCTLYGFQAIGSTIDDIDFRNCNFLKGRSTNVVNMYASKDGYTFENCTFADGYNCDCAGDNVVVNIDNCVYTNGRDIYSLVRFDKDLYTCKVKYNGVETYTIKDKTALKNLATKVNEGNNFSKKVIRLISNIDLNNEEWTPIGNGKHFSGVFDGGNYTISNLLITGNNSTVGLFGNTTNGEIKNLTVENAKVSGYLNVGVVAGNPYTSKYTNVKVKGHVEVNGFAYVGGVGGKNAYANWTDITIDVDNTSYVYANSVDAEGTAYRTYAGGAVGFNGEGGHTFKNITSNINVKGSTIDVGGLFGIAHYGNNFINCKSTGNVEIYAAEDAADAEQIGGIAGVWHNQDGQKVTFKGCIFEGTLKTNVEGVDLSDNRIHGAAYSTTGTGTVVVE